MVDISKAKSELSAAIKFVVSWLDKHGFDAKLKVYNTKKTVFEVSKDGVSDTLEITASREKMDLIHSYMAAFEKAFALKCENQRLKKELESLRISGGFGNAKCKAY